MLRSSVLRGARRHGCQIVDHAGGLVEFLVLVLGEIVGLGVVAQDVFAGGHGFGAGEDLDHGGFAGTVDAHEGETIAALDDQVAAGKHDVIAVGFGDLPKLRNNPAARFGLGKAEMDGLLFGRNLDPFDFLEFLDPALYLFRLGGLGAEAVDEGFQLLHAVLLIRVGGLKLSAPLVLQHFVTAVTTGVKVQVLVPQLDDLSHGDVEEVAVVGYQDVRIGVGGQVFFQPVAGFQIEVVGGLVQ